MKFNNLMNQKKYTISIPAKAGGVSAAVWAVVGVSAEAWALSSTFFSAWGGAKWDGGEDGPKTACGGEGGGGGGGGGPGAGAGCVEECSMRVEILS